MITSRFPLGNVSITNDYFAGLVSMATKNCYGVAAMGDVAASETIKNLITRGSYPEKGVLVTAENGRLAIELHIQVAYGLNITSIVKSITHRVRDEVESATGLKVSRINVCVDDIITD